MCGKRIIWVVAAFTIALVLFQSCYNDTTLVIDNNPAITKTVSFANDIVPIFNKSCSVPGCHIAGGIKPDLSTDKAYTSLTSGNYLNVATPDQSVLYLFLTGKKSPQMPLGAANNPSSINQLVLAWMKQGGNKN